MNLIDGFTWITRSVLSAKQRSVLTVAGIAIGITAVALLTSVGEGLRHYLLDSFSQFGTRIIAVTPGKSSTQGMPGVLNSVKPLSIDDAESLRKLPYVTAVVAIVNGTGKVEADQFSRDTNIFGVSSDADKAWKINVSQGRFLPADDPHSSRAYAVLGSKLKQELFGDRPVLGEFVRVGGTRFRIIGVMESKGQLLGFDLDDIIYIPVARGLQLFDRESLMEIDIVFDEFTNSTNMSDRITRQLVSLHGIEDFTLFTQEDMLSTLDDILRFITLAVASIGGISLFVGGVGVVTIMMTSLQERASEIGLLSALGSTRQQILSLFLGEAVVLSCSGGLIGIVTALGIVFTLNVTLPNLPLSINVFYLLLALLLSLIIGLIAGILPALKASRLNPIETLRNE
ncbi:ABC transporter permease [Sessilibacter corallicola]|uniref:ABC transporter permease n=1 Tax=Sessilibacter corallicola TaxID=2904075 RepID=UPI001E37CDB1|nr:ABC transporter permease [Sessilibacter corallicola]